MSHGNNRRSCVLVPRLFQAVQFSFYILEFEAFVVIIIVIFLPILQNYRHHLIIFFWLLIFED